MPCTRNNVLRPVLIFRLVMFSLQTKSGRFRACRRLNYSLVEVVVLVGVDSLAGAVLVADAL